jgi:hypothetical protein
LTLLSDTDLRTCLHLYGEPIVRIIDDDNWWRIGILAVSKNEPLFQAGFAAPIVELTRFVLQPFEVDGLQGCAIILLTGGQPFSHFAGWVPAARAKEAEQWLDVLNRAVQRVKPQTPLSETPEVHVSALHFEVGSENAPDSAFGLEVLDLTEDGALTYERRRGSLLARIEGSFNPARFQQLIERLRRTSFPNAPQTRFVPGGSIVRIAIMPSRQAVDVDYFEALRMDGYREVVRDLSRLAAGLRDSKPDTLGDWKFSRRVVG